MTTSNFSLRRKFELHEIAELKAQITHGPRAEVNTAEGYRIWIVRRGEGLFYQENDRALICDLDVLGPAVARKSLSRWDTGKRVTDDERALIQSRIESFFERYHEGRSVVFF